MSLPVFYTPDPTSGTLSGTEGRHAVTVKRIQPGERILLADAHNSGLSVELEVTAVSGKDTLWGKVLKVQEAPVVRPAVTVVQALPKSERSELAVDLATQVGADEIIPWQAVRCEAKWVAAKVEKHVEKWRNAATAAAKQSRRVKVPLIHQPMTTRQLVQYLGADEQSRTYVLHEDAKDSITQVSLDAERLYLCVGPEGGVAPEELSALGGVGAVPVALGPEVYRTASAAMVALAAIGALRRW